MNIKNAIELGNFNGFLTISDIHGEYDSAKKAVEIAFEQNLLVIFLGDLLDGGCYPTETLLLVKSVLDEKLGILILGNHDDKLYRYVIGNKVKLSVAQLETLEDVNNYDLFADTLKDLFTHPLSSFYSYLDNYLFVHGAAHRTLWDYPDELSSKQKATCLYGEVDGTRDERGWPNRTYGWCEDVPNGHIVFVGHDRSAKGKSLTEILEYTNSKGGKVYFTDCSCGKTPVNGPLGIAVVIDNEVELFTVK